MSVSFDSLNDTPTAGAILAHNRSEARFYGNTTFASNVAVYDGGEVM